MLNIKYLRDSLGNALVSEHIGSIEFFENKEIELLQNQSTLCGDTIYIGTKQKVIELLGRKIHSEQGALILSTDTTEPIDKRYMGLPGVSLIESSMSLIECYNMLNGFLSRYRRWQFELLSMKNSESPQRITEYLAKESGASVFIIDTEGFVLAGYSTLPKKIPVLRGLISDGRVTNGQLGAMKYEGEIDGGFRKLSYPNYELTLYNCGISYGEHQAIVIFAFYKQGSCEELSALVHFAQESLKVTLQARQKSDLPKEDAEFELLWKDIVSKRYNNSVEIKNELSKASMKPLLFARIVIISFDKPIDSPASIISELHSVFTNCRITVEETQVVVLLYHPKRLFSSGFDSDLRLRAFLEKHDAYLGHSGATRDYSMIPTLYELAKQVLTLGRQLALEEKERIFTNERYSVFCMIELCTQRFNSVYGNNNIVYLSHPAIIHLTRFDRDHNNNLREVLYVYLMNDCSISKTAAITFMHRNTIFNKLKKIEEILHINFEDGAIRQQLLFSCQLIFYYERVMKMQLNLDLGKDENL